MFQEVTFIYATLLQACPKSISYCKLLIIVLLAISFYEHPPDPKIAVPMIKENKQNIPLFDDIKASGCVCSYVSGCCAAVTMLL